MGECTAEAPLLVPKKVERSEQEKREIKTNLEKQSERLTATLIIQVKLVICIANLVIFLLITVLYLQLFI